MQSKLVIAADALILFFCIVGIYHVFEKAGLPVVFGQGSLAVERVTQQPDPLLTGDTLLSIDGIGLSSIDDVEFVLDSRSVDDTVHLLLARNGAAVRQDAILVRYFSSRYLVIQIVTAAIFIILGVFVYGKRRDDRAAQLFHVVTLCSAVIIATTWGRYTIEPYGLGHAIRVMFHVAYAAAPVLFVHFTLVFPTAVPSRARRMMWMLYAAALIIALATTVLFFQAAFTGSIEWFRVYNASFNALRTFFVLCIILGCAIVVRTYAAAQEESERRKLRWVLLGLTIGPLCFITLWIVPQILTSRGLVDEEYIILTMLSVPVAFAISIVKYHILNIDQFFNRATVYAIMLFVVLALYAAIVSGFTLVIKSLTVTSSLTVSVVAAIAIAVLIEPLRRRTQAFVDRVFFNVRYNYREAEKRYSDAIHFSCDDAFIASALTATTEALIPNDGMTVLLEGSHDAVFTSPIASVLREQRYPLALRGHIELGASYIEAVDTVFAGRNAVIAFGIHSQSQGLLGIVLLGRKRSGFRYNLEDIDLLESFCHQSALALDRIALQQTIMIEQFEKKRLHELNELKSYFVSSVTHELKTPLTSIRMFAELIEGPPKLQKKKQDEYLEIIRGESERLTRLIDNVLDISKIEKGMKEYHFGVVDLNACVKDALAGMQYQLSLNGFSCRADLTSRVPLLHADRDAVIEIVINLLSNAIKYASHRRSIVVSTRRTNIGSRLVVEDLGIGIAKDDLAKIFEPFERTDSPQIKHTAGTGLGLALVKHITDAHHARLEVVSEPGKRTRFIITFPLYVRKDSDENDPGD